MFESELLSPPATFIFCSIVVALLSFLILNRSFFLCFSFPFRVISLILIEIKSTESNYLITVLDLLATANCHSQQQPRTRITHPAVNHRHAKSRLFQKRLNIASRSLRLWRAKNLFLFPRKVDLNTVPVRPEPPLTPGSFAGPLANFHVVCGCLPCLRRSIISPCPQGAGRFDIASL